MKKLTALSIALLIGVAAQAQEFKPFKVNVSVGAAIPVGGGGGGTLFAVEPKYGITDQLDLGLRLEGAGMARDVLVAGNTTTGNLKFASSAIVTGTYFLSQESFRPFVGLGTGVYTIGSTDFAYTGTGSNGTSTNGSISAGSVFGGMGRAGFKTGHFVLGIEYNLLPNSNSIVYSSDATNKIGTAVQSKNSYGSLKVGFDIGGGRRR